MAVVINKSPLDSDRHMTSIIRKPQLRRMQPSTSHIADTSVSRVIGTFVKDQYINTKLPLPVLRNKFKHYHSTPNDHFSLLSAFKSEKTPLLEKLWCFLAVYQYATLEPPILDRIEKLNFQTAHHVTTRKSLHTNYSQKRLLVAVVVTFCFTTACHRLLSEYCSERCF